MDLYKEILVKILSEGEIKVSFTDVEIDLSKIIEGECYKALCEIKDIIHDNTFDDCECVEKIERVICSFERIGSTGGMRHDY